MAVEVGSPLALDIGPALASLDRLNAASQATADAVNQGRAALQQSATEMARQATAYSDALARQQQEQRAATAAIASARDELRRLTEAQRELGAAQKNVASTTAEYQRIGRELTKNKQAIAEVKVAIGESTQASRAERAAVEAIREARRQETNATRETAAASKDAAAAVKQQAAAAQGLAQQTGKAGEAASSSGGLFGSLQSKIAAAFSLAAIKAFIGNVIEAGQATEATLSKLTFANGGDAQAGARDLAFLRNEAQRLGLELNGAGQSYGSFAAAAAAGNFPLSEARKLFLATAGASATLKLSAADTQGVLLALTQILSKGTVSAEELRGQIGERLPGAFAIAARSIGKTEKELGKLLQTGQLKSTDFLPKFAEELQKTFGDGTAQAADSFTANLNRIENEFTAFFLRFQGTASKGTSTIAKLVSRLNAALDLRSVEGRQRLGEQQAQQGIQDYEAVLNGLLSQAEAQAKTNGEKAGQAAVLLLARQRGALKEELAAARIEAQQIEALTPNQQLNFPGGRDALRDASVQAQRRVALLEGEIAKTVELAAARKKADDATDLDGLIKKQQDLIKTLQTRQQAATSENKGAGGDFLLGKGGLNEELKAAQKELDRLLGKVEKVRAARQYSYESQLRALLAERATLESLAGKAAQREADSAADKARLVFDQALAGVEAVKAKLEQRELDLRKAAQKAGGTRAVRNLGEKADGQVDGVQAQQLSALRVAALNAYYAELNKIEQARQARLFELRAESDQKEIDTVNRKYDALLSAQKLGQSRELDALDEAGGLRVDRLRQQSAEEVAIAEARERDLLRVRFQQATGQNDEQANAAATRVSTVAETYGTGTGISIIEAKQAEKRALLEIEQQHARRVLQNSLLLGAKEGEIARANAQKVIAQAAQELTALDQEKAKHRATDGFFKLVFGENDSDALRQQFAQTAGEAIGAINQVLAVQLQAEQAKIGYHQQNITDLQSQLSAEIQLNREGSASNIKGIQDRIKAEQAAKAEALAKSREIAKEQQTINDLQAISSIGLAVANIIAGWSTVPLVGSILGIIAASAMVAGFVATKSAAANAASTPGFFQGGYTGDGDPHAESQAVGPRPYTYHRREFVLNHELTDQYRWSLLEPLHTGRPLDWGAPEMKLLLPDLELPQKMAAEKANHYHFTQQTSLGPVQAELAGLRTELAEIKASNARMADRPDRVALGDGRYMEVAENGGTNLVKVGQ